jgi:hypothetical protein
LEKDFPKIPKENGSEVETIYKMLRRSRRLIFGHLLAVNPCGLQAKK